MGRLFKEGHWLIPDFTHMRRDEGPLWKKEKGKWERRTWEVMGAGRKEEIEKMERHGVFRAEVITSITKKSKTK